MATSSNKPVSVLHRRKLLAMVCAAALPACWRPEKTGYEIDLSKLNPEEKARAHRFRGVDSIDLAIDGFGRKIGVNLFDQNGRLFNSSSEYRPNQADKILRTVGPLSIPVTLRGEWRDDSPAGPRPESTRDGVMWGGNVIGNYTVPVAERIPDALLDELRKNGGQLRLKIRLHDDGLLIGWDIARRPGYKPGGSGVPAVFSMTGGDFKEAIIFNGKAVEKGWYIHPKTGQRIETDF